MPEAADWVAGKAWQPGLGKLYDYCRIPSSSFIFGLPGAQNRPLLDDVGLVTAWYTVPKQESKEVPVRGRHVRKENLTEKCRQGIKGLEKTAKRCYLSSPRGRTFGLPNAGGRRR